MDVPPTQSLLQNAKLFDEDAEAAFNILPNVLLPLSVLCFGLRGWVMVSLDKDRPTWIYAIHKKIHLVSAPTVDGVGCNLVVEVT